MIDRPNTNHRATVLIYEDNIHLRSSIIALLQLSGELVVLDSFSNCDGIEDHVLAFDPDLLIMDIDMPGVNGIEGITKAKSVNNKVKILMYTVFDDEDKIFAAIRAGADGYLLKNAAPQKLLEALHDLINGESAMTPAIARKVLNYFSTQKKQVIDYALTEKEKEVLRQLTKGLSYKMIADACGIGIETVRTHLKRAYTKLQVNSSTQAVSKAINEKLI